MKKMSDQSILMELYDIVN